MKTQGEDGRVPAGEGGLRRLSLPAEEGESSANALILVFSSPEVLENEFLLSHSVKVLVVTAPGD